MLPGPQVWAQCSQGQTFLKPLSFSEYCPTVLHLRGHNLKPKRLTRYRARVVWQKAAPKIAFPVKLLADQLGTKVFAFALNQAAVGLMRENNLRNKSDEKGVDYSRKQDHNTQ